MKIGAKTDQNHGEKHIKFGAKINPKNGRLCNKMIYHLSI